MNVENLKFVVGAAKKDEPAYIRFFSGVCEETASAFINEFLWLQETIKPSKIVVLINSEGGSVIHGMGVFSTIQACPIEVDCVIEGIAASMGSIIWAAGDNLYMHDYSLLMIHNPFYACKGKCDDSVVQMVNAFKSQVSMVYKKRFGMSDERVESIMNGIGEQDGTFFSAKEAVRAGLISQDHIIKTHKHIRDKVKNEVVGLEDVASMRDIMTSIAADIDESKLIENISAIHKQKDNTIQEHKEMNEETTFNFDAISAQLGFSKDVQLTAIQSRITELLGVESALKEVKDELDAVKIMCAGKETELDNTKQELSEVKAALKTYQDAEVAAREADILATVDAAIADGKIDGSKKEAWVEMAHTNFDMVKSTLESIPGRENIEKQIANEPNNVANIEDTLSDVDKKLKAEIEARFGKTEFKKF